MPEIGDKLKAHGITAEVVEVNEAKAIIYLLPEGYAEPIPVAASGLDIWENVN